MTILITGATGHVGVNLISALLKQGQPLRALIHNNTAPINGVSIEKVKGDVLDLNSLHQACQGIDVVYHLAAFISIDGGYDGRVHQINVEGTANMIKACLAQKVRRLIHFSSIHALAYDPLNKPVDETRPLAVAEKYLHYDRSKATAETIVLDGVKKGLDAVILNPVGILGPNDFSPSPMGAVILKLCQRKFPALIKAGFHWVDVRDVVEAALAAETKGKTGERYILTSEHVTLPQIAKWIEEFIGVKAPRLVSPMWLARIGAHFVGTYSRLARKRPLFSSDSLQILRCHQQISGEKAIKALNFRPRPIRETIADTLEWLKNTGRIPGSP